MGCKTGGQCFPEKVLEHVWLGVSADSSHITNYSKPGPLQCCCSPIVGGSGVWALSHWISGFGVPPGLCPRCPLGLLSHLRAPSLSLAGFSSSRAFEQREGLGPSLEVGWRPHSVRATVLSHVAGPTRPSAYANEQAKVTECVWSREGTAVF